MKEEREAKRLLSSLALKTRLSKITLFGYIFFWVYKMNEIENKFLLVGIKFVPEMHIKEPGFAYSACGPSTKNKERIVKFMQTGNTDFIYRNELGKVCSPHDIAYDKSKVLTKRTQSEKVLGDKTFKIASDPKYMAIKED